MVHCSDLSTSPAALAPPCSARLISRSPCPPPSPHTNTYTRRGSIYNLYCDYVLKNPFHQMDQVMKSELFDSNLIAAMTAANRRYGAVPQAGGE